MSLCVCVYTLTPVVLQEHVLCVKAERRLVRPDRSGQVTSFSSSPSSTSSATGDREGGARCQVEAPAAAPGVPVPGVALLLEQGSLPDDYFESRAL